MNPVHFVFVPNVVSAQGGKLMFNFILRRKVRKNLALILWYGRQS